MKEALEHSYEQHSSMTNALREQASVLEASLSRLSTQHRDEESVLRKKKCKLASEVKNWIDQYDEKMGTKEAEITQVREKYKLEHEKYAQLKEYFSKVSRGTSLLGTLST